MTDFSTLLGTQRILVADGAWGTELMKRAELPPGEAPEVSNLANPDAVAGLAQVYREVGADIVITNSFGGTPIKLKSSGLADRAAEVSRLAASLSKQGVAGEALVFGSVGPTGQFVAPLGTVTETEMVGAFAEQIKGLVEGGADGILVESMSDLTEIQCAVKAAQENCERPVVASLTFDRGPAGYATMMGVKPAQAAEELSKLGLAAVGANCGLTTAQMVDVIQDMNPATDLPLWAKANAGAPQLINSRTVFPDSPEDTARQIDPLIAAGARIIGGCCGTTPEHIAAIRREVDRIVAQD